MPRRTALPAGVLAEVVPLALALVQRGIEAESERYRATYSSRAAGILYECDGAGGWEAKFDALRFLRTRGGPEDAAFLLDLEVTLTPDASALRLDPVHVSFAQSKSKVAWASWWPWRWVASAVWAPWFAADRDVASLDLNAQVSIDVIAQDTRTKRSAISIGSVDFPLGRYRVDHLPVELSRPAPDGSLPDGHGRLHAPASGWLPLPAVDCESRGVLPVNFRMTLMEANDLGDVIAEGAQRLEEQQDALGSLIRGQLGAE